MTYQDAGLTRDAALLVRRLCAEARARGQAEADPMTDETAWLSDANAHWGDCEITAWREGGVVITAAVAYSRAAEDNVQALAWARHHWGLPVLHD